MSKLTLSFKGTVLKVFPILRGQMLIGHDPACHLHIDSLALAPRHARVDTQDQTSILVDLETEQGTFVNQKRIDKHLLENGDIIRIGKHTLQYIFEEVADLSHVEDLHLPRLNTSKASVAAPQESEKPEHHAQKNGWLQILNGQNLGRTLSLNRSMTNLGKPGVATAIITRRDGAYFLSHLEGKRPPSIDDQPIGDRSYKLHDGNTIQIGNIKMQFYME